MKLFIILFVAVLVSISYGNNAGATDVEKIETQFQGNWQIQIPNDSRRIDILIHGNHLTWLDFNLHFAAEEMQFMGKYDTNCVVQDSSGWYRQGIEFGGFSDSGNTIVVQMLDSSNIFSGWIKGLYNNQISFIGKRK